MADEARELAGEVPLKDNQKQDQHQAALICLLISTKPSTLHFFGFVEHGHNDQIY